jgi:hypothetical protein
MALDKKFKKKWIKALRSGDYVQGTGKLCTVKPSGAKYCCLGVAAELAEGEDAWIDPCGDWTHDPGGGVSLMMLNSSTYTYRPKGLNKYIVGALVSMNDGGKSFEEIASYIEHMNEQKD